MKKIKKIGLLLGIGFMLVNNVSAKEMAVASGGMLYDEENKTFLTVEEGTRVNTIDGLETHKGYYVNYNNKKYFVQNDGLVDVSKYAKWEEYKEARKPKYKGVNTDKSFEMVNFTFNEPRFNEIVDNYRPSGETESQVLMSLVKYISDLDLTYRLFPYTSQWETIKDGYTACYGGTYLEKNLLDKTNLKYRIVHEIPINYDTEEQDPYIPTHIFAEVQINGKWVNIESTSLFNKYDSENNEIKYRINKDVEALYGMFLANPVSCDNPEKVGKIVRGSKYYKDVYFKVSGTYRKGKKVEDNGFAVMVSINNSRDFLN